MPNQDELIIFYYNRMIVWGKNKTLPFMTYKWAEELLVTHQGALEELGITVAQALVLLENSRDRIQRL